MASAASSRLSRMGSITNVSNSLRSRILKGSTKILSRHNSAASALAATPLPQPVAAHYRFYKHRGLVENDPMPNRPPEGAIFHLDLTTINNTFHQDLPSACSSQVPLALQTTLRRAQCTSKC